MTRSLVLLVGTLFFGAAGFAAGYSIHGPSSVCTIVSAAAGAAGGFGIGGAGLHVLDRWRNARRQPGV